MTYTTAYSYDQLWASLPNNYSLASHYYSLIEKLHYKDGFEREDGEHRRNRLFPIELDGNRLYLLLLVYYLMMIDDDTLSVRCRIFH